MVAAQSIYLGLGVEGELTTLIRGAWLGRADRYSEMRAELHARGDSRRIEMYYIGG